MNLFLLLFEYTFNLIQYFLDKYNQLNIQMHIYYIESNIL